MADVLIRRGFELLEGPDSPVVDPKMSSTFSSLCALIPDFVELTERQQLTDSGVKTDLECLKDLCYEMIDVVEELKLQRSKNKKVLFLGRPVSSFYKNPFRRHSKMKGIIDKFHDFVHVKIDRPKINPMLEPQEQLSRIEIRETCSYVSEADVHGRDDAIKTLTGKLLSPKMGQKQGIQIQWISIVGEAGIGKTTLAQVVYNRSQVVGYFDLRCWICVSKEFNLSNIAMLMLQFLTSKYVQVEVGLESMFQRIHEMIMGKRCLFVLDDVWGKDYHRWEQLENLLNYGAAGSTVLITTRDAAVARAAGSRETDILRLGNLSQQDCLSIIRDRAFRARGDEPGRERLFNKFGKRIALKCHGVPSVANSLGYFLHLRRTSGEWIEVLESYAGLELIESEEPYMVEEQFGLHQGLIQEEREKGVRQQTTSFVNVAIVHGRDDEKRTLIRKLLNEDGHVPGIQFISIVGKAGMGKTTLAQLVYNCDQVKSYFDLRSWIYVSNQFNLLDIAKSMLQILTQTPVRDKVQLESLFQRIHEEIMGKRCCFVLDNVWSKDYHKWEQLKNLFNHGAAGSTILITTCDAAVARAAGSGETDILHLGNLLDPDCSSIIRDLAISASDDEPLADMFFHILREDLTQKCHGVPLAAKSLGFILREKTTLEEWREVLESYVPESIEVEDPSMEEGQFGFLDDSVQEKEWEEGVRRQTTSFVHEARMHGRDDERTALIGKLLNEDGQAQDIQYISIVGKAGIGKTALAQLVYNDSSVKHFFDLKAWVFVGEQFNPKQIVMTIMESLNSDPVGDVEMEALKVIFSQNVEGKRCLFVLDDIWSVDNEQWLYLKALFTTCNPGSRILITTRYETAADVAGSLQTNIIRLSALSDSACWSIIKDHAFGTLTDETAIEMIFKEVGKDIVKKCEGMPLIAKSLGGILRGRDSIKQWREVLGSDVWDSSDFRSALMLSYSLMPSVLRQCLLYCSIFPKNHSIDVDKLIKLWMAHGFIASDKDEMEREGWRYVKELLRRFIFQEFKQGDSGNFECQLDSGMCDFIHFLAQNECHVMLLDYEKEHPNTHVPTKPRHCTLDVATEMSLPEYIDYAGRLHTFVICSKNSFIDPTNLTSLLSQMKLLRALDLSSCSIKELPLNVGELLLLRYLDLSFNHDLKKLPKAICNLLYLQTLNLNGCDSLRKLPKGMGKLIDLRHLEILWTTSLSYLPKGIAGLTRLRTLNRFFGNSGAGSKACNLGDLKNINSIQGCITIDGLNDETEVSDAEKASLKNKTGLLGLELWFSIVGSNRNNQHLLDALEPPPQLQCLGIFYYGGSSFPSWMIALKKLTHLMLADCTECINLPPLGKLPSLKSLEIKNMSKVKMLGSEFLGIGSDNAHGIGEEGSSSTVAFRVLQKLRFEKLVEWEEWAELDVDGRHANVMPLLSSLLIKNCPKLRAIPDSIKRKAKLTKVIEKCPLLEENPGDRV